MKTGTGCISTGVGKRGDVMVASVKVLFNCLNFLTEVEGKVIKEGRVGWSCWEYEEGGEGVNYFSKETV